MKEKSTKERSHLYPEEDWMTPEAYAIRREFYGATAGNSSNSVLDVYSSDHYVAPSTMPHHIDFKDNLYKPYYASCSQELFDYSLHGIKTIKIS